MMKIPVSVISLFIVVQESVIAKAVVEGSTVRGSYMVYIFVMYQTGLILYILCINKNDPYILPALTVVLVTEFVLLWPVDRPKNQTNGKAFCKV